MRCRNGAEPAQAGPRQSQRQWRRQSSGAFGPSAQSVRNDRYEKSERASFRRGIFIGPVCHTPDRVPTVSSMVPLESPWTVSLCSCFWCVVVLRLKMIRRLFLYPSVIFFSKVQFGCPRPCFASVGRDGYRWGLPMALRVRLRTSRTCQLLFNHNTWIIMWINLLFVIQKSSCELN